MERMHVAEERYRGERWGASELARGVRWGERGGGRWGGCEMTNGIGETSLISGPVGRA